MKNTLLMLLATVALTSVAKADVAWPAWTCELQVENMHGWSVAAGKAFELGKGRGTVHCESADGETQDLAVKVKLIGAGVGIGITHFKNLDMKVMAAGLTSANDIFGTLMLQKKVQLTLFRRAYAAGAFVTLNRLGASVGVEFSNFKATGLQIGAFIEGILITPDHGREEQNEPVQEPALG